MSVINTNISSMQAQASVRTSGLNLASAMERLSSGVRINSAKDDAAGLAISTRMTASIRGISAAIRNANDGISLTQTAEGSLSQISDNLQRIRELAVQSANTGNNASDRAAMNNESKQLIAEIDRVASNTTFNGIKLLDGTFQAQSLQVGAGNGANDRISVSIANAKASALGNGSSAGYSATANGTDVVASSTLTSNSLAINGFSVGSSVTDGVSFVNASGSGIAKATAINAISGNTGVTATVDTTTKVGIAPVITSGTGASLVTGYDTATTAGSVMINGVDIGAMGAAASAAERGAQTAATINAKTSQTGVTATFSSAGVVSLAAVDGRNITVSTTTAGGTATGLVSTVAGAVTTLADTVASVAVMKINGVSIGEVTGGANAAATKLLVNAAINAKTSETGVSAAADGSLTIASGDGRGITVEGVAAELTKLGYSASSTTATSSLKLTTTGSAGIVIAGTVGLAATGLTAATTATIATSSSNAGAGVAAVDLTTAQNSQDALATLDLAIDQITNSRASMGAYQNRLTASISNLETTSMNLSASRSRILDTDYAKETTNLAKSQIIQQAATAMLAQANQSGQSVLALLK
jgi:flagellin